MKGTNRDRVALVVDVRERKEAPRVRMNENDRQPLVFAAVDGFLEVAPRPGDIVGGTDGTIAMGH
jgi:hypothetical protein